MVFSLSMLSAANFSILFVPQFPQSLNNSLGNFERMDNTGVGNSGENNFSRFENKSGNNVAFVGFIMNWETHYQRMKSFWIIFNIDAISGNCQVLFMKDFTIGIRGE